ncbi:MAG TPA: hypothetical protein VKV16_00100 [Solirubrobacteraceae bacterium]|nr:hypothetical protein [Solirubrobacteraceae bacterium]
MRERHHAGSGEVGRLDVGGVIRRVLEIYVDQAPVLMPAAAVVFVFTGILSTVLVNASSGLRFLALLIGFVASMLFTAMVVELVADVRDGRRDASAGQLLRAVTPVLGQLVLVGVIAGIAIGIGFVLVVVPGLVLLTMWFVAAPVIVLERPAGLAALGRSRELVRGNGWQVFGVIAVMYILVVLLSALVEYAADSAGTGVGIVVTVVIGVLTAPFAALASAVVYFDLRAAGAAASGAGAGGGAAAPPAPEQREADAGAAPDTGRSHVERPLDA